MKNIEDCNANKLRQLSDFYSDVCPALGRFYASCSSSFITENQSFTPGRQIPRLCTFCYSPFWPSGCTISRKPKMAHTKKTNRLLSAKELSGLSSMSKLDRKLLNKFESNCSKTVLKCKICRKDTIIKGPNRLASLNKRPRIKLNTSNQTVKLTKNMKKRLKRKKADASTFDNPLSLLDQLAKKRKKKKCDVVQSKEKSSVISKNAQTPDKKIINIAMTKTASVSNVKAFKNTTGTAKASNKKHSGKDKHKMLQNILKNSRESESKRTSLHDFLSGINL